MKTLALAFVLVALASAGDPPRLVRLEVFPQELVLEHRYASAQLVLTGLREDGARVDVTREARIDGDTGLVRIDERGFVRPLRDGEGTLQLRIGELAAAIPLRVSGTERPARPGFARDVQPVLTRLGCNAGTCHGSGSGKNGFKLSLRGYDAEADHAALTDELAGRRFDRAAPEQSLFLLKPTATVPHEGGKLLERGSPDWELLRDWVASGVRLDETAPRVTSIEVFPTDPTIEAPGAEQQFAVIATFGDGSRRDVTAHAFLETGNTEVVEVGTRGLVRTLRRGEAAILARYEGRYAATRLFVMGDRSGFAWQAEPPLSWVDELVDARLAEIRTLPSATCSDEEFLRRAMLDLCGTIPTPEDVETFVLDTRETQQKRGELVDRLIGSPDFVAHWTNRWCDLLSVNGKFLGAEGARALRDWVRGAVASNLPYDAFVRALIDSSGSTLSNPPAAYYKIHREPDLAMENTTQLFLGVRFNCNKCHDHPFERWTQRDHWQLAAYFADVTRADVPGSDAMPESTVMKAGQKPPAYEETIGDGSGGKVSDPNGRQYAERFPFESAADAAARPTRRAQLARWLTAKENPYFARSYVNRVWSYLLGVGLIEPVDDLRAGNPPTNPALLDALTAEFVANGFDVRKLLRRICTSRSYQRSVVANDWNADDETHFAKARARRLPAEVLFDALHRALGVRPKLPGTRPGTRARDLVEPNVESQDGFLDLFGRPPRESACECERSDGMSLGQALNLVNGPTIADAIASNESAITELARHERDDARLIDALYLRFLGRRASDAERAALRASFDPFELANVSALRDADVRELATRQAAWEAEQSAAEWLPVEPGNVRSEAGTPLVVQPDGSVLAGGEAADRDTYEFVGRSSLATIRGIRIEVLPDASFPKQGPGRSDSGNFVLAHLSGSVIPIGDLTRAATLRFRAASADFSQEGWPIEAALVDDGKGWGIYPRAGEAHQAVFELEDDLGAAGGNLVVLRLHMPFGSKHVLGRFRVSVTDAARPIRVSQLDGEVAAALRVPAADRSDAQRAVLHRAYLARDEELRERLRLGMAQDLAWALATSPAFLFNR
ncbi:MAG: DUF1553 domain-containing protein [Planctomycetes bacterium]|nr:DUF1553 domain-containing protein [Planctomycetota bacterium]